MELNMKNNGQKARLVVITALVSFSVVFMLTGVLMTHVYGAESETLDVIATVSIGAGVAAPINVDVNNSGFIINEYVEKVKQDICPTLSNQTQIEECWRL
jgi:hypothetical protein